MQKWLAAAGIAAACLTTGTDADWLEWGGDNRDFTVTRAEPLQWPEDGPRELWRRPLGDGYSAILAEDGVLYTMVRSGAGREALVALSAKTGKTLWEYEQSAPLWSGFNEHYGPGPHATPVIHEDRIYGVGVRGDVFALEKDTGRRVWRVQTWDRFDARPPDRGYASSPMVLDDRLIVPVGGRGQALVALRLEDGKVVWKSGDYANAFSSPILVDVDGRKQIVAFLARDIVGFDARTGQELWSHPHHTQYDINASTPVWGDDNILVVSSAYDTGGRALKLSVKNDRTEVNELWFERKFQVHHGSAVRVGNVVYGSHGDFGPAFLTGIDARSGELLTRQRGFGKTNMLAVGDRILLLDEDGTLALARPAKDGSLEVLGEAQIFDARSWTAPTLVGTRVYARNKDEIVALELGR